MARRRSIYETGAYQTPLADFLEEIPNYFLKFEQLKLQNKKYDNEQAYRAARDKESDRRWNLTQEEKVKNKRLDTAKIKLTQQLNDANQIPVGSRPDWLNNLRHEYSEFPELQGIVDSRISVLTPYVEADKKYKIIDSDVSELNTLSTDESFGSHYNRLEKRNELFDATRDLAEGSKTRVKIESDIALLDKTLKFERDNAGKRRPDAEWSREDLDEFGRASGLVNAGIARQTSLRDDIIEKENELSVLEQSVGGKSSSIYKAGAKEINDLKKEFNSLIDYKDKDGNIIKKGSISKNREIMKFIEDRNTYPELKGTPEILEGGVSGYEPKTEVKEPDIERYILNNPEQGFDAWMDFITNPSEESENKFSSMLNEFVEGENTIDTPPPPPPVELPETVKGAMAVIEKKRQGAEPDVDLAEKIPEDIPKAWTEPATEDVVEDSDVKIPAILGGLQAQTVGEKIPITEKPPFDKKSASLFTKPTPGKDASSFSKVKSLASPPMGAKFLREKIKKLNKNIKISETAPNPQTRKNFKKGIPKLRKELKFLFSEIYDGSTGAFYNPYTKPEKGVPQFETMLKVYDKNKYENLLSKDELDFLRGL